MAGWPEKWEKLSSFCVRQVLGCAAAARPWPGESGGTDGSEQSLSRTAVRLAGARADRALTVSAKWMGLARVASGWRCSKWVLAEEGLLAATYAFPWRRELTVIREVFVRLTRAWLGPSSSPRRPGERASLFLNGLFEQLRRDSTSSMWLRPGLRSQPWRGEAEAAQALDHPIGVASRYSSRGGIGLREQVSPPSRKETHRDAQIDERARGGASRTESGPEQ